MGTVLFNTFVYLIVIALGYGLKKRKTMPGNAGDVVAQLVVTLTLPAMLLYSSNGMTLNLTAVGYLGIGFGMNIVMLAVCAVVYRKEEPVKRAAMMLSSCGTDVGNFALPFIVTFFPGEGVMVLTAFNIGNTIMIQGFNYLTASLVSSGRGHFGLKDAAKRLFSSVTFDTYLLILLLAGFRLTLPERVMEIVRVIANANIFLVMVMIGLKLERGTETGERGDARRVILVRLSAAVIFGLITWVLPISRIARIAIITAYFAPPASVAIVYAKKLGYDGSMLSRVNVICIFLGMLIITALMLAFYPGYGL